MHCAAEMYAWCFGPYASLRGFGNGGPNPRYLLTLFLVLNGLGAEHVIRWYLRRGYLNELKDANHVHSIFEALKTDQFHRQHKSYKRLLVSSNYEQMSKPAAGDAWVVAPIPETSDDVGVMHSIANATVMLKMRTLKIPGGIEAVDTLKEELRIDIQAEFNYFNAPTARSLVLGTAYEQQKVNVFSHLNVMTLYPKELPTRGITNITSQRVPGKLVAGPYPAEFYADLDVHADKPNSYHLHAIPIREDVDSCAIERGCAPQDATLYFKPAAVTMNYGASAFPILNRGEWTKEVQRPGVAPTPVVQEQ